MRKEVAYTAPEQMPRYVNFSTEDDIVTIYAREAPREFDGVAVCGVDCRPGDRICNNYCGKSVGVRHHRAPPKTHKRLGTQVAVIIPKAEFEAMIRQWLEEQQEAKR